MRRGRMSSASPRGGVPVADSIRVLNEELLRIPMEVIETVAGKETKELERRERVYHGDRALLLATPHDPETRLIVTMRPRPNPLSGGCR